MGRVSNALGKRIYLDSNMVIYAIEGMAKFAAQIQPILDAMDGGEIFVVTSELTLAEVLVGPIKAGNFPVQQTYRAFLTTTSIVEIIPITRPILEEAARLRATTRLKLPDAIHLATALHLQCDSFVTNDDLFRSLGLNQIKMLTDLDLL